MNLRASIHSMVGFEYSLMVSFLSDILSFSEQRREADKLSGIDSCSLTP